MYKGVFLLWLLAVAVWTGCEQPTEVRTEIRTQVDTVQVTITDTMTVTDTVVVVDTLFVVDTAVVTDTIFVTTEPGLIARGYVRDLSGNPKPGALVRIRWSDQTGALPGPFEAFALSNATGQYESIIETNACDVIRNVEIAVLDSSDWSVKASVNRSRDSWCNIFLGYENFAIP